MSSGERDRSERDRSETNSYELDDQVAASFNLNGVLFLGEAERILSAVANDEGAFVEKVFKGRQSVGRVRFAFIADALLPTRDGVRSRATYLFALGCGSSHLYYFAPDAVEKHREGSTEPLIHGVVPLGTCSLEDGENASEIILRAVADRDWVLTIIAGTENDALSARAALRRLCISTSMISEFATPRAMLKMNKHQRKQSSVALNVRRHEISGTSDCSSRERLSDLFGVDVSSLRLDIYDEFASEDTPRLSVGKDMVTKLSQAVRERRMIDVEEVLEGGDSPKFEKALDMLASKNRDTKHRMRRLQDTLRTYFSAGRAFVKASKDVTDAMQKDGEDIRAEGFHDISVQSMRKQLILYMRELEIHLQVLLDKQEDIMLRPITKLTTVEAKMAKQAKERYEKERSRYLSAMGKYQAMNSRRDSQASMEDARKQVSNTYLVFENARRDAYLKLSSIVSSSDINYIYALCNWLDVTLSFFEHGVDTLTQNQIAFDKVSEAVTMARKLSQKLETEAVQRSSSESLESASPFAVGSDAASTDDVHRESPSKGEAVRPDSSEGMNMSGFLLKLSKKALISRWQRRWFIVDGKRFYYKRHADDVEHAGEFNLTMASVRPARNVNRENCFEVVSSGLGGGMRVMVLQAATPSDMQQWMTAIANGISAQLDNVLPESNGDAIREGNDAGSAESVKEKEEALAMQAERISSAEGNFQCADCGTSRGVEWCSLNLCVVICIDCAGVHRSMGVHISVPRSFKLDILDAGVVNMLSSVGNASANKAWEASLEDPSSSSSSSSSSGKPKGDHATREERDTWIREKYEKRNFVAPCVPTDKLISAAGQGDSAAVLKSLASGCDCNGMEPNGASALSAAAQMGHTGIMTMLLLFGANVSQSDRSGWTPLHAAAFGGSIEAARLLIAKGADPAASERHGVSSADVARHKGHDELADILGSTKPGGSDSGKEPLPRSRRPSWAKVAEICAKRRISENVTLVDEEATALFDYAPKSSRELQFSAGDIINVTAKHSCGDWWFGETPQGRQGIFPSAYVESKA
eukprot:g887.t1